MIGLLAIAMMVDGPTCALPFKVVGTEASALSIAATVIASAPDRPGSEAPYLLKAEYFAKDDRWLVFEYKPGMLGGDGLQMFVASCDGAVSNVRRQR